MSNFDYTSRYYDSIQEDLLERASRIIPEWTSRDASDFGMVFVDLWAYMGDVLHYYVDRAAGESYLNTATQRESVLSIASLFDYIPTGRSSSLGEITLDITNSVGTDTVPVLLPKYTRFLASPRVSSASPVIFTLNSGIAITQNITGLYTDVSTNTTYIAYAKNLTPQITATVTEGEKYEEFYTSSGTVGFNVRLDNTGIVRESVEVEVTEGLTGTYVVYSPVTRLLEATSNERVFTVEMTPDDYSIIGFGNGVNGVVPPPNSTIKVNYRRSRGAAGNLPPYSINSFDSITLSTNSNISGILVVGNTSPTIGGSNSESLELMKVNIPLSFRTQDRAVSLQDYKDLSLSIPGVAKSNAQFALGTVVVDIVGNDSDYLSRTVAQNSIITSTGISERVADYIEPRSMIGVNLSIANEVDLERVAIRLSLSVLNNYIRENVVSNVTEAIRALFSFDNVEFDGLVSLGTLYRTILAVPGVDYANVSQFTTQEVISSPSATINTIDSHSINVTPPAIDFEGVKASAGKLLYIASDRLPTFTSVNGGIVSSVS
jgi:hypothetical protein